MSLSPPKAVNDAVFFTALFETVLPLQQAHHRAVASTVLYQLPNLLRVFEAKSYQGGTLMHHHIGLDIDFVLCQHRSNIDFGLCQPGPHRTNVNVDHQVHTHALALMHADAQSVTHMPMDAAGVLTDSQPGRCR